MRIKKAVETYNSTWHSGIDMTPLKARNTKNSEKLKMQEFNKQIQENESLIKDKWQKLKPGTKVIIKDELVNKKRKPKFKQEAIIMETSDYDTYILETGNGRKIKRHASQLKVLTENP